jgi:hypothetical protein
MRKRYIFSLAIPVLNWASTMASFHVHWLYNCQVYLPGNAISTLLGSFLTLFSKLLVAPCLACATLSIVDHAPVSRAKPLISCLLLENSNQAKKKTTEVQNTPYYTSQFLAHSS